MYRLTSLKVVKVVDRMKQHVALTGINIVYSFTITAVSLALISGPSILSSPPFPFLA